MHPQPSPDLLIRDVRLVDVDGTGVPATPVDVRVADSRVVEVGPALPGRGEPAYDGSGGWLLPGLWDHHVHLAQWTLASARLDLAPARSAAHAVEMVAERLAEWPDLPVIGWGHRPSRWPDEPVVSMLDGIDTEQPIVLIAGGKAKGLEYGALADAIVSRVRAAVLIGETADELTTQIAGRVPVERATSMEAAVATAAELARPGDVALLAPAAASFDMFVDYAARGEAFRAAVAALEVKA